MPPQGSEAANLRCSEAGLLAPWFLKLAAWSQGFPPRAVTIQTLQVRASTWSWGDHDGFEQEAWFPSSQVSTAGLCIGDGHPRVSHIGQGSTTCRVIETNTWFQGEGTWATTMQFTLAVRHCSPAPSGHESPQHGPLANPGQQHYPPCPPQSSVSPGAR